MVDVVIATASEDEVASSVQVLPDEYYKDLVGAVQDGSEKASDMQTWLEKRRSKICKYYYSHEGDNERLQYDEESSDEDDTGYLQGNNPGQIPAYTPTVHTRTRYGVWMVSPKDHVYNVLSL